MSEDRLHPEGAPGEAEIALRLQLGDATYETVRRQSEEMAAAAVHEATHRAKLTEERAKLLLVCRWALRWAVLIGLAWSVWGWVR